MAKKQILLQIEIGKQKNETFAIIKGYMLGVLS